MNILFYITSVEHYKLDYNYKDYFGWGGTEDYVFNLTEGLKQNGHDITVGGYVVEGEFDGIHSKSYETLANELNHYDVVIGVKHVQFLKELVGICTWDRSYVWVSIANFNKDWDDSSMVQITNKELNDLKLLALNYGYAVFEPNSVIEDPIKSFDNVYVKYTNRNNLIMYFDKYIGNLIKNME